MTALDSLKRHQYSQEEGRNMNMNTVKRLDRE